MSYAHLAKSIVLLVAHVQDGDSYDSGDISEPHVVR